MHRTGFVIAAGVLSLLGCSADSELIILQNQVPQAGCVVDTNRTAYRGEGVLDLALVGETASVGYRLNPLVQNAFPAAGETAGHEPNRVYFRSFRINITLADTGVAEVKSLFDKLASDDSRLLRYEEPWSGSVDPGGLAATAVTAIPAELGREIRATGVLDKLSDLRLLVHARLLGDRSQGSVTSGEFTYPVRLCVGCLIANRGACPVEPVNTGNECNIAQDKPVDCCTDGKTLICPSRSPG